MFTCAVRGCKSTSVESPLKFFCLPEDSLLRNQWISILSFDSNNELDDVKICELHFKSTDFNSDKMLKNGALPIVHLYNEGASSESSHLKDEEMQCSDSEPEVVDVIKAPKMSSEHLEVKQKLKNPNYKQEERVKVKEIAPESIQNEKAPMKYNFENDPEVVEVKQVAENSSEDLTVKQDRDADVKQDERMKAQVIAIENSQSKEQMKYNSDSDSLMVEVEQVAENSSGNLVIKQKLPNLDYKNEESVKRKVSAPDCEIKDEHMQYDSDSDVQIIKIVPAAESEHLVVKQELSDQDVQKGEEDESSLYTEKEFGHHLSTNAVAMKIPHTVQTFDLSASDDSTQVQHSAPQSPKISGLNECCVTEDSSPDVFLDMECVEEPLSEVQEEAYVKAVEEVVLLKDLIQFYCTVCSGDGSLGACTKYEKTSNPGSPILPGSPVISDQSVVLPPDSGSCSSSAGANVVTLAPSTSTDVHPVFLFSATPPGLRAGSPTFIIPGEIEDWMLSSENSEEKPF